jgi:hypothetical protein
VALARHVIAISLMMAISWFAEIKLYNEMALTDFTRTAIFNEC